MTASVLITPPTLEPVSLSEFKAHARIDITDDDALALALIKAARQWVERYTSHALNTQTWQLWLDTPPTQNFVRLAATPVISVSQVKIYDNAGNAIIWDSTSYFVDTFSDPARLALRNSAVWPTPDRLTNGMMIEYTAGYGAAASDVPEALRLAIKQLATHWYEHRGEAVEPAVIRPPVVVEALLSPYARKSLA